MTKFYSNRFQHPLYNSGKFKKILIAAMLVVAMALALVSLLPRGIADVAKGQLEAIQTGDVNKAYNMTSQDFQKQTSLESFTAYVNNISVLKDFKRIDFKENKTTGDTGFLSGTVIAKDGTSMTIEYQLIKEKNTWKIQAMRLTNPTASTTTGKIYDILISDSADTTGYVIQPKTTVSPAATNIFATVQIIAPVKGITVSAMLTSKSSGGQIGPSTTTITQPGNIMKAFSFSRSTSSWPKGEYEVTVTLSSGDTKTVSFNVE